MESKEKTQIQKIVVKYKRPQKVFYKELKFGNTLTFIDEQNEKLVINRQKSTLVYTRKIADRVFKTQIKSSKDVLDLFEAIPVTALSSHKILPKEYNEEVVEFRYFKIKVFYNNKESLIYSGIFDVNGLPEDWLKFIATIIKFINSFDNYELFNYENANNPVRKKNDLMFCNVTFEDGGKTYCYLSNDDSITVGDYVVVPAGIKNKPKIVKVESIEYASPENSPYTLRHIKTIIRKCTQQDFDKINLDRDFD